jgi:hypothetical protein
VPADFTEVVYVVGGAIAGIDAIDCLDVEGESSHPYVAKMVFPDDEAEWVGTYFMNYPRVYHNTVILADGSLLAVGGVTAVDNHCSAQLTPERFEPPEVIASTEFVWDELASQEQKRGYHSIACLLPDGTVVSGGGDDKEDQDLNSEQSVEVFHPPYCYPESDRPDVVTSGIDPATTKDYEQEVEFDVRLKDSNTSVERVALLRPSSVTHGADMDQRYVELALSEPPQQVGTRMQHVTVQMPLDEFYAPPGYYMLFVVDSHGKVGHAVWIQLLQL